MRLMIVIVCVALSVLAVQGRAGRLAREGDEEDVVLEADEEEGETGDKDKDGDGDGVTGMEDLATTQNPNMTITCEDYDYCQGQSFEARVRVNDRAVKCDTTPDPKERCCLPQRKHLVCYNIKVEGQNLNYDRDDFMLATDYSGLCKAMVESAGRTFGQFSGASWVDGTEGNIIYRYGRWTELDEPGTEQLQDIACEVTDEAPTTAADDTTD